MSHLPDPTIQLFQSHHSYVHITYKYFVLTVFQLFQNCDKQLLACQVCLSDKTNGYFT